MARQTQIGTDDVHCGFPTGSVGTGTWSRSAFVKSVPPHERFDIRVWHTVLIIGSMSLLAVAGALLLPHFDDDDQIEAMLTTVSVASVLFYISAIGGLTMLFTSGFFLRRLAINKVAARSDSLFDPSKEPCMLAEVEVANTANKLKFQSEDMGLICARNGWVDFEFMRHRARFPLHELQITIFDTPVTNAVKISYTHEVPNWSIVITPLILQKGDARDVIQKMGAERCIDWIQEGHAAVCRCCKYDLQSARGDRCPECGVARYVPPFAR